MAALLHEWGTGCTTNGVASPQHFSDSSIGTRRFEGLPRRGLTFPASHQLSSGLVGQESRTDRGPSRARRAPLVRSIQMLAGEPGLSSYAS
jgi:hypothetical protein